jgi:hypothetical protein
VKRILLRCFTILLGIILLTGLLPVLSYAADNELVLTKIGHTSSDTVSITNPSLRSITLTVPFSYTSAALDLSSGLIVDKAPSIDSVITSFSSGASASIGEPGTAGPPVSMTVTYYKNGNTTNQHTTNYAVSVIRAAKKAPTFAGTITKSVNGLMPGSKLNDITFTADEFTKLYTSNDGGPLKHISITGSSLSCGSLKLGSGTTYMNYESGKLIGLDDIGRLVFDAVGSGSVSYIVSAYAGTDTDAAIGSVLISITVNTVTVPTISGAVYKSTSAGSACAFSLSDFSSLYDLHNGILNTIEIMPANTGIGTWSSGSATFTGSASFTAATIGSLKFTGSASGTASFTWRVSNEAGYSETSTGTVTVKAVSVPTITSSVVRSVNLGATLSFSLGDFSSCFSLNNGTLANIVITPSGTSCGTWHKGSSAFTGSKTFSKDDIGTLKFKGTQCGQASFTWTVSNERGTSAAGSGLVTVNALATTISYTTAQNTVKEFLASDFKDACKDATGAGLSHICFNVPPTTCGTLYFGYSSPSSPGTAITSKTKLYYGKSPKISDVTFVPATNYTGTLAISYTGVTTNSVAYAGDIRMIVGNGGDVSYQTPQYAVRTFDAADFNRACGNVTGAGLSYVYFSLPSSSFGTLYYGYSSPLSPGTAVSPNSPYSLQNLYYITFVPAANYAGTVTIPYTGVASTNASYTGYIKITVSGSDAISYTAGENKAVRFAAADFNDACLYATGSKLHSVLFALPPAATGRLCYNYSSISSYESAVKSDTVYYMESAPHIGYVTFVPAAGWSGTAVVSYAGYSVNGTSYTGNIAIQVGSITGSIYFSDVGPSCDWAAGAIDYLYDAGVVKGTGGSLYSPATAMTRGDFLLMLHRAMGYTGSTQSNFSDVPKGSYYYDAIAIAKALGIARGSNNKIGPNTPLTRQDAMVYIYRALLVTGVRLTPGTNADIAPYTDKGSVSKYALEAVQSLVKAGMIKGSYDKLNPASVLSRAEMAVVLYRVQITY